MAIDSVDKEPIKIIKTVLGDLRNVYFVLPTRQFWMCDVLAYGCSEHSLARFRLSKKI